MGQLKRPGYLAYYARTILPRVNRALMPVTGEDGMTDTTLQTEPPRLRRKDASDYLKRRHGLSYTPGTLAKLFTIGGGPPVRKAGRAALYEVQALDAWAEAKLSPPVRSSAELAAVAEQRAAA